jgi:hypothetical protein
MLRRLLSIAAVVVLFQAGVAPASAALAPSVWYAAPAAPCAAGSIETYGSTSPATVTLTGWITPCQPMRPTAKYGFMIYTASAATEGALATYDTGATTSFTLSVDNTWLGFYSAICLAYSPAGRLSCFSVRHGPAGLVLSTIPASDPLVGASYVPPANSGGNPACASCV